MLFKGVSPDARFAVVIVDYRNIDAPCCLWSVEDDRPVYNYEKGHRTLLNSVVFSADSRFVALNLVGARVEVYSTESAVMLHAQHADTWNTLEAHAFSHDGELLILRQHNTLKLWHWREDDVRETSLHCPWLATRDSLCVAVSQTRALLAGSAVGHLVSWFPEPSAIRMEDVPCTKAVCWSPNGKWYATWTQAGDVHLYDASTNLPVKFFPVSVAVHVANQCVAFSPDSRWMVYKTWSRKFAVASTRTMRTYHLMSPVGYDATFVRFKSPSEYVIFSAYGSIVTYSVVDDAVEAVFALMAAPPNTAVFRRFLKGSGDFRVLSRALEMVGVV